ncbi:MAG: AAA family ATPase [Bacteroidota bacterium]
MFFRKILNDLSEWANEPDHKPLILRGARQVGKTTAIELFAREFTHFLSFNLDNSADLKIFKEHDEVENLVPALFFTRRMPMNSRKTLVFIDEIQNSPKTVAMLRYLHEQYPQYHILAAGSLLETLIDKHITFPVGRVDFRIIRPVSFFEFLNASGETQAINAVNTIPFPLYAHDQLLNLVRTYAFIGGMPAIVQKFLETRDLVKLQPLYDSLIASYLDDVEKYAPNDRFVRILRFVISQSFYYPSTQIKFQGFGKSTFGSRDIGDAFRLLEKALLLQLVYPTVESRQPLIPDIRKSPKLQLLDTGLVNFISGLQQNLFGSQLLSDIYEGRIAEHLTGQELLSLQSGALAHLNFWVREKRQAQAEIDFLFSYNGMVIPVEVKSNTTGHLRSLYQFIDMAPHGYAVRVYSGKLTIEEAETINGKKFRLLNLPFYLIHKMEDYLGLLVSSKPL